MAVSRTKYLHAAPLVSLTTLVVLAELLFTASGVPRKPGSLYTVSEFQPPSDTLNHMALNVKTEDVYIGAVNNIYQLDSSLKVKFTESTLSVSYPDHESCPPKPENKVPNNINKILVVDIVHDWLIVCGTIYGGICQKRHLANLTIVDEAYSCEMVVRADPTSSVIAFLAPGHASKAGEPQPIKLYVGVSAVRGTNFYIFSSRQLQDMTLTVIKGVYSSYSGYLYHNFRDMDFSMRNVLGYSYKNFSYKIGVQKIDIHETRNHTVIARVCQSDGVFGTYMEMTVQCHHNGVNYTVLQAAYVGKPGRDLAVSLGLDTMSSVMFSVFSLDPDRTSMSAVCIFPLELIRRKFTENINYCRDGRGYTGGGHLGKQVPCSSGNEDVDDDYCPITGVDEYSDYLFGAFKADVAATMTFNNTPAFTSLAVTETEESTVGFLGAADGSVYKVSLHSNTTSHLVEVVSVTTNESFLPDTFFDHNKENLYLLSSSKVVKMKVQNCLQYTSCSSCLGARDPYCGWCSLQSKCSQKSECSSSELTNRWLSFPKQECPKIKQIISAEIPIDQEVLLTLDVDVQNVPELQKPIAYQCQFFSTNVAYIIITPANRSNHNFQCYTPPKAQLPPFEPGKDSVSMKLWLQLNDTYLVSKTVTFFNCAHHTVCTSCTQSKFPCSWCIKKHMCTDRSVQHCQSDTVISGQKPGCQMTNDSNVPCEDFTNVINFTVAGSICKVFINNSNNDNCTSSQGSIQCGQGVICEAPVITISDVSPRVSLFSGGTRLTIRGTNVDKLHPYKFTIDSNENNTLVDCKNISSNEILCKTPTVSNLMNKKSMEHIISHSPRHCLTASQFSVVFQSEPNFSHLDSREDVSIDNNILVLYGENLPQELQDDIKVKIGGLDCSVLDVKNQFLSCNASRIMEISEIYFENYNSVYVSVAPTPETSNVSNTVTSSYNPEQQNTTNYLSQHTLQTKTPGKMGRTIHKSNDEELDDPIFTSATETYICYNVSVTIGNYHSDLGVLKVYHQLQHDVITKETLTVLVTCSVLFVITVILVLLFVLIKRKHTRRKLHTEEVEVLTLGTILNDIVTETTQESMDEFILQPNDVILGDLIGSDKTSENIDPKDFILEAVVMKDFRHPNVLQLLGLVEKETGVPYVILPYMDNGDLLTYVRRESVSLSLHDVIKFGADIASGMAYLSSLKFVHRDLAARNCMLDSGYIVKVADFGLCRDIYEKGYYRSDNKKMLPIRWMAVESIEHGSYSTKSDVWSFGVVLWELLTRGLIPYPGIDGWDIFNFLSQRRLDRPHFCPLILYKYMTSCWAYKAERRPTFTSLASDLYEMIGYVQRSQSTPLPDVPNVKTVNEDIIKTDLRTQELELVALESSKSPSENTYAAVPESPANVVIYVPLCYTLVRTCPIPEFNDHKPGTTTDSSDQGYLQVLDQYDDIKDNRYETRIVCS